MSGSVQCGKCGVCLKENPWGPQVLVYFSFYPQGLLGTRNFGPTPKCSVCFGFPFSALTLGLIGFGKRKYGTRKVKAASSWSKYLAKFIKERPVFFFQIG